MTSGIYMIQNKVNGKRYIGKSVNLKQRWSTHQSRLDRNVHKNDYLQNSWDKYGNDAFKFFILEYVSQDRLLDREQWYLDNIITFNEDYNLSRNATGGGSSLIDRSGERHGRLMCTEEYKRRGTSGTFWKCVCDCGEITWVNSKYLGDGTTKSCGCYRSDRLVEIKRKDISGNEYGRLIVKKYSHTKNGKSMWLCECDCGNEHTVSGWNLRSGHIKSCGCYKNDMAIEIKRKLTAEQVDFIKYHWVPTNKKGYITLKDIGELYNVSGTAIGDIKRGVTWKHV